MILERRRPRRRRGLWLTALLALALAGGAVLAVGLGRDPTVVPSVLIDRPAPALSGPTLDGPTFDLAGTRGEVTVVNVWASWCVACRAEHPELEAAYRRLAPYGVQFVGINTQDTVQAARAFLADMGGSSYPSVLDPQGRKVVDWGVFGVPETFLIDHDGRIRQKAIGAVTEEWLVNGAGWLLAEEEDEGS